MAMKCPLCDVVLHGRGVFITNPRHIRFVQKVFPDFRPQEKVCPKCKKDMEKTYDYKYKRALALRAQNQPFIGSSSSEEPPGSNESNSQKTPSTQSSEDSNRPTTSAQAAAKRKKIEEIQRRKSAQNTSGINVIRGVRLPHITPAPKRQQFVHLNPDVMDIYLQGIKGG